MFLRYLDSGPAPSGRDQWQGTVKDESFFMTQTQSRSGVAGVILAGGQARRLGGVQKPLLMMGKTTILDQIRQRLGPQVDTLALSLHAEQDFGAYAPVWPDLPCLFDPNLDIDQRDTQTEGRSGPLGGILAAVQWAEKQQATWLTVVPGDVPFLPVDFVSRLLEAAICESCWTAHAASRGRGHFACAVIHLQNTARIKQVLDSGERRVGAFLEMLGTCAVSWSGTEGDMDPFFNINTPDDLGRARQWLDPSQARSL